MNRKCKAVMQPTRVGIQNDLISRQAAIDTLEKVAELFPWRIPGNRDSYDRYNEAWNDAIGRAEIEIEKLPSAQPEPDHFRETKKMIWHECDSDDPSSFPDDDRAVLVSFPDSTIPAVGWFERNDDFYGWTDGERFGLHADGWWELPKKPTLEK